MVNCQNENTGLFTAKDQGCLKAEIYVIMKILTMRVHPEVRGMNGLSGSYN